MYIRKSPSWLLNSGKGREEESLHSVQLQAGASHLGKREVELQHRHVLSHWKILPCSSKDPSNLYCQSLQQDGAGYFKNH